MMLLLEWVDGALGAVVDAELYNVGALDCVGGVVGETLCSVDGGWVDG